MSRSALLAACLLCLAWSAAPLAASPAERNVHKAPPPAKAIPAPPDVAAPPADAEVTASGLASKVLKKGTGSEHPGANDSVQVHYTGWTTDGKMFDSSVARGKPLVFPLFGVIPGWREGVQLMVKGEKRRLWIPGRLAYDGVADRPQGMLVFDVELLDVQKAQPKPEATPTSPTPPPSR